MKNFIINLINFIKDLKPVKAKELSNILNEKIAEKITTDKDIFVDAMEREYLYKGNNQALKKSYTKTMKQLLED